MAWPRLLVLAGAGLLQAAIILQGFFLSRNPFARIFGEILPPPAPTLSSYLLWSWRNSGRPFRDAGVSLRMQGLVGLSGFKSEDTGPVSSC